MIEAGRITEIRGDGYQAELIRKYMADFDDADAYGLSHIGWGLDERAKWAALATIDFPDPVGVLTMTWLPSTTSKIASSWAGYSSRPSSSA